MRRHSNQATTVLISLVLLLTQTSSAQRVEVSAVAGTMVTASGVGLRLKLGPENNGWIINGAITVIQVSAGDPGGFKPGTTTKFLMATPYVELSPSDWFGIGFSPTSIWERNIFWFPQAMFTANFPIRADARFNLLPSIQLAFPLRERPLPFIYLGIGIVFSLE